jgi:beta-lactamase superfamily II metal-dependent hydrolase
MTGVTVRMYNVGLGDSFLLTFPSPGGDRKVLIDCGVHQAGPGPHKLGDVVDQIIADVTVDGRAHIDVVIATHRHRDHVHGFEQEEWANVEVGEVWMPWTEDPKDPEAKKIREIQSKKATSLCAALRLMGASAHVLQIAENALTNAKAMATLKSGFAGDPLRRYLPPKKRSDATFTSDVLPGVTIHAMGPSRDREVIRDMNPPKGESYLRLVAANGNGPASLPFAENFVVSERTAEAFFTSAGLGPRQLKAVERMAQEDPFALAVALDAAVNGTSLMLMFEMGRALLLFPGDAQWGTWQNALADDEWHGLLEKTTFYKVGHHGSHNATPKDFVESVIGAEFAGMVCTAKTKKFPSIPRLPLLKKLREKSGNRIARSDDAVKVTGFTRKGNVYAETQVKV